MAFLELKGITKRFPGCLAVDHLDLDVEEGDFLVLLGPSGCGKTTTLRVIAGLEVQTGGKVILDGVDVSDVPPERRDMAMVFQNLALYPHMTVFDNIAFYLRNIRTPREKIQERVTQAARKVQIEELLGRYPDQLSGGQRQRVALARALVRSPKVFLLDEPLAALDAKLRASMRSEFKLLHRSLHREKNGVSGTFIYVTHDQVEALTLGTRIAVMNEGRLAQLASPHELYSNPYNLFTATFVGSPEMNLIHGDLRMSGERVEFCFRGLKLGAGERGAKALGMVKAEIAPIVLGIRPESVQLASQHAPDALPAQIVTIEPLGQNTLITMDVAGLVLTCLVGTDTVAKEGEVVGILLQPECMHFFDPQSGDNLLRGGL